MSEQASPQLENGYTRIANELLDALLEARLTARQWNVVMSIVRKTYGYNKKEDDLSASQIGAICAMNRTHVTETLNQLARMNIISKRPGVHGSILSVQKDYTRWIDDPAEQAAGTKRAVNRVSDVHYTYIVRHAVTSEFYIGVRSCKCHPNQDRYLGSGNWIATIDKTMLRKEVVQVFETRGDAEKHEIELVKAAAADPLLRNELLYESSTRTESVQVDGAKITQITRTDSVQGVQESDFARTESVQVDRTESVHTKDNLPKENKKTDKTFCAPQAKREMFDRFYDAYPRKRSRQAAEKAFAKIDPDEQLLSAMLAGIERAMKSGQWQDPQFIPYPASWLNAAGWMDDVQTEYSDAERAVIQAYNDALGEQLGKIDPSIFSESRAFAIRTFLTLSEKPNFWLAFFPWVRDFTQLPPHVGFDWLISRDGFTKVKGGQHTKREAA